jgi:hypothetical protein
MTADNFCFYLQNRQFQTSQTGGQLYSDSSYFSIPWLKPRLHWRSLLQNARKNATACTDFEIIVICCVALGTKALSGVWE